MSTTISISPHSGGSVALDCKHLFGGREMDGLGDACIIVVCGCVTGLETNKIQEYSGVIILWKSGR